MNRVTDALPSESITLYILGRPSIEIIPLNKKNYRVGEPIIIKANCKNCDHVVTYINDVYQKDSFQKKEKYQYSFTPSEQGIYQIVLRGRNDPANTDVPGTMPANLEPFSVTVYSVKTEKGLRGLGLNPTKSVSIDGNNYTFLDLFIERPILIRGNDNSKVSLLLDIFDALCGTAKMGTNRTYYGDWAKAAQQALARLNSDQLGLRILSGKINTL